MIRQHDVQVLAEDSETLAEGTFRLVLTRSHRVVTAIDVPDSALGPLHLVFAVSPQSMIESTFATGGFDLGHAFEHVGHDLGHGLGKAAEATFNVGSKMATTLARPAFELTKASAAAGAALVAHVPFVPEKDRKKIEAASRTIMRARLGDVNAQQFIHAVVKAAKDGQKTAQHIGDALIDGSMVVTRVLDTPMSLLAKIPKVGGVIHELDPLVKMQRMGEKLKKGDFQGIKTMIENDAKAAQGVISLIPGIGTGISAAISLGVGILDGGGALDIAIETVYGAIPIPAGIRQVTDVVLGTVLQLIHNPHNLTDALLAGARNAVPAGMARDVFDTLANLIVKHMPVTKAAGQLVDTYVQRYAPGVPIQGIGSAAASVADAAIHHQNVGAAAANAVGDMARKAVPGAAGELIAGAAHVVGAVAQKKNLAGAVSDAVGDAAQKIAPGAVGGLLSSAAHVAGAAAQGKNLAGAVSDAVGDAAQKIAPGAVGGLLSSAAHVAGAAAQGKNVGAAVSDAVGNAAQKIAPGAVGGLLSSAAHVAGAAAQGKNLGAAIGSAVGDVAQKVAPGAVGGPLGGLISGAAHIAGAAAQGKDALVAVGDAARGVVPGALGQGLGALANVASAATAGKSPLRGAGEIVVRQIPGSVGAAIAKYLPGGAIPLPSPTASTVPLLSAGAGRPGGVPLLAAGPGGLLGTIASTAVGAGAHGGNPVGAIGDLAKGLVPGAADALGSIAQVGGVGGAAISQALGLVGAQTQPPSADLKS